MTAREEIKALREKLGLSRTEFARLTRLGEATIARWERGELIQNAGNDSLLRLLQYEDNVRRLRRRAECSNSSRTCLKRITRWALSMPGEISMLMPLKNFAPLCGFSLARLNTIQI